MLNLLRSIGLDLVMALNLKKMFIFVTVSLVRNNHVGNVVALHGVSGYIYRT